jgi:hypothetical protein
MISADLASVRAELDQLVRLRLERGRLVRDDQARFDALCAVEADLLDELEQRRAVAA